jgi:hypothetical protein
MTARSARASSNKSRRDVGEVPTRASTWCPDAEVPLHAVRQRWRPEVANRRLHPLAPRVGGVEAVVTDESLDALVVGAEAPFRQLVGETRRAVGIVEVVDGHNLVDQVGLVEVPGTRSSLVASAPLVVGRGRGV